MCLNNNNNNNNNNNTHTQSLLVISMDEILESRALSQQIIRLLALVVQMPTIRTGGCAKRANMHHKMSSCGGLIKVLRRWNAGVNKRHLTIFASETSQIGCSKTKLPSRREHAGNCSLSSKGVVDPHSLCAPEHCDGGVNYPPPYLLHQYHQYHKL